MARLCIKFDDRERALFAAFSALPGPLLEPFCTSRERLALGDIHIHDEALEIIVERKRVDDLMASLFDGRLAEQSQRLRQWQNNRGVIDRTLRNTNGMDCRWTVLLTRRTCFEIRLCCGRGDHFFRNISSSIQPRSTLSPLSENVPDSERAKQDRAKSHRNADGSHSGDGVTPPDSPQDNLGREIVTEKQSGF